MSITPPGSPTPNRPADFGPPGSTPSPFGQQVPPAPPGYPPPPPPFGQQTPPGYAPFTPHDPGTQHGPLAGFGTRLGAWVVDWILYGITMAITAVPGIYFIVDAFDDCSQRVSSNEIRCLPGEFELGSFLTGLALIGAGALLVGLLYVWALATSGQTWGRRLVGVKVIDEQTGEAPGWGKAIGRTAFAWFISGQILYIGYLWMLWDDRQQTLHDKVAGTHVIKV